MKLLLATVALSVALVDGYSQRKFTGDDLNFACNNVYPNHFGLSPMRQNNPYSLQVTNVPGGKQVTITGSKPFVGFILQAQGGQGEFVSPSNPVYQVPCPTQGPTIRHDKSFPDPGISSFSVTWSGNGGVSFKGAAVVSQMEFYELSA